MDVKVFAVSVQYGKGHHYFVRTDIVLYHDALTFARAEIRKLEKRYKRGAKPTVYIWQLDATFTMPPVN